MNGRAVTVRLRDEAKEGFSFFSVAKGEAIADAISLREPSFSILSSCFSSSFFIVSCARILRLQVYCHQHYSTNHCFTKFSTNFCWKPGSQLLPGFPVCCLQLLLYSSFLCRRNNWSVGWFFSAATTVQQQGRHSFRLMQTS